MNQTEKTKESVKLFLEAMGMPYHDTTPELNGYLDRQIEDGFKIIVEDIVSNDATYAINNDYENKIDFKKEGLVLILWNEEKSIIKVVNADFDYTYDIEASQLIKGTAYYSSSKAYWNYACATEKDFMRMFNTHSGGLAQDLKFRDDIKDNEWIHCGNGIEPYGRRYENTGYFLTQWVEKSHIQCNHFLEYNEADKKYKDNKYSKEYYEYLSDIQNTRLAKIPEDIKTKICI